MMTYYLSLASYYSAVGGLYSSREANSAYGLPSAPERRECKSRVTLLLRDADSGQIDHMRYGCRAHPWASPPMQQLNLART